MFYKFVYWNISTNYYQRLAIGPGDAHMTLTKTRVAISGKLIAFVTFTAEGSRLVVADGILVTDIRDGSAFVHVWWGKHRDKTTVTMESSKNCS